LFPEDTPLDLQRILQRTHAGESIRDEETAALRDNGEKFFASLTFAPVRNVRGNVTAVSLTIRDLTQRKRAEEQLHWAQVGKLASGLVHEVRNPLNAMRVQIAVARNRLKHVDGAANEAARSQLEHLEQEVLRVHNLASEFLAYGRPHPDKLEQIDLKKLISDVVEFIRPECEAESTVVRLECRTASPSPTIVMDQEKLRQALFNLTENARQAMPNGGELTITIDQPAAHEMRVRMYDTGHGIPANQLPRVFEAFYSTRDGGTGLGLAIVKRTIEAAGGRVDVQSEPGGGTCFDLYFPQACASTSQAGVTMVSG
jgi:signal transduction histidine kinase